MLRFACLFTLFFIYIFNVRASAADLYLVCEVTYSSEDGSQTSYKLRYEIVFDTRMVVIYEDDGSGWRHLGRRRNITVNDDEIILQNTNVARYSISRSTGKLVGKRKMDGVVTLRGDCEKSSAGKQKF